jgi:hypothetical protein
MSRSGKGSRRPQISRFPCFMDNRPTKRIVTLWTAPFSGMSLSATSEFRLAVGQEFVGVWLSRQTSMVQADRDEAPTTRNDARPIPTQVQQRSRRSGIAKVAVMTRRHNLEGRRRPY